MEICFQKTMLCGEWVSPIGAPILPQSKRKKEGICNYEKERELQERNQILYCPGGYDHERGGGLSCGRVRLEQQRTQLVRQAKARLATLQRSR